MHYVENSIIVHAPAEFPLGNNPQQPFSNRRLGDGRSGLNVLRRENPFRLPEFETRLLHSVA
jgi:hypothetical protein